MPDEINDIQKLAEYALKFFEEKKRGKDDFWTLKDRHPKWLYELIYKVHENGKWPPDDYKYLYVVEALSHLEEGMDPDEPELEADVYTSDILKCFSSHGKRLGIVDEAMEEIGWEIDKGRGIEGMISFGQWREKENVFRTVAQGLLDRLEEIEAGVPETFRKGHKEEGTFDWEPTE